MPTVTPVPTGDYRATETRIAANIYAVMTAVAPTPLPTPDAKATEARIASNIFATATAAVPTVTPTPTGPRYPVAYLENPTRWASIWGQNSDIRFAWRSPVNLQKDEWFVIYTRWTYDYSTDKWSPWCLTAWSKDTQFTSTGDMRFAENGCFKNTISGVGKAVQWYVVIQNRVNDGFTGLLSPESERWQFLWGQ